MRLQEFSKNLKLENLVLAHIFLLCLVFFLIDMPLSPDEAHYALWTRNLDWSYYSKGPLLALSIKFTTSLFGMNEHAVRLPALLFNFGSILLLASYLKRNFSNFSSIILYLSIISSVSFWYQANIITTDSLVTFFWILSSLFLKKYFDCENYKERKISLLVLAAITIGLGVLTKYTILILMALLILFMSIEVFKKRESFKRVILLLFLTALFLAPIVFWNFQNNWVNILHNSTHLGVGKAKGLKLFYFFDFLAGQIGIFGLFLFPIIYYLPKFLRNNFNSLGSRFVVLSVAILFFVCLSVSLFKRIYPNWTIPIYPIFFIFMGSVILEFRERNKKLFNLFIGLNFLVSSIGILLLFGFTFGVPGKILPTKKLVGWRDFSSSIENFKEINKTEIIFTESYDIASELGFYSPNLKIYNAPLGGRRMNQFDLWQKKSNILNEQIGKDILIISSDSKFADSFREYFSSLEIILPSPFFEYEYSGKNLRTAHLYVGRGYNGIAFPQVTKR